MIMAKSSAQTCSSLESLLVSVVALPLACLTPARSAAATRPVAADSMERGLGRYENAPGSARVAAQENRGPPCRVPPHRLSALRPQPSSNLFNPVNLFNSVPVSRQQAQPVEAVGAWRGGIE